MREEGRMATMATVLLCHYQRRISVRRLIKKLKQRRRCNFRYGSSLESNVEQFTLIVCLKDFGTLVSSLQMTVILEG